MLTSAPTRRRLAIAVAAITVPIAAIYAWNVWRNVDSLARVERACGRIREARASAWASLEEPAIALFADDLPIVGALFAELGDETCHEVPRAIGSPLSWRWGATWRGAPYPEERMRALSGAAERAIARCPAMLERALGTLAEGVDADAACADVMTDFRAYADVRTEAAQPVALWEWPARLEHLAASLESVPPVP